MGLLISIIVISGGLCGLWAFFTSDKNAPQDQQKNVFDYTFAGAMMVALFIFRVAAGFALLGLAIYGILWILGKLSGA
jgi:hypothetical protein